jgi:hypothetical protein
MTASTSFVSTITRATGTQLKELFAQPHFNAIIPDAHKMIGCDQGTQSHLEGDVAEHTARVFDAIIAAAHVRFGRDADAIERLAAVIHDVRKPQTRLLKENGSVSFPGHEALAAAEVPDIGARIGLSAQDIERLYFMVAHHGTVHSWHSLPLQEQQKLQASPCMAGLALLQEADARSCILPGNTHPPVLFDDMMRGILREERASAEFVKDPNSFV